MILNPQELKKLSRLTLEHYNQCAEEFREGTRYHDVSQNVEALLQHKAVSAVNYSGLRDEIAKLTRTVSDLAQRQASAGRDQVFSAMGPAGESLSQSADEVESRIKRNPWGAVAIAALVGLLIGRMS